VSALFSVLHSSVDLSDPPFRLLTVAHKRESDRRRRRFPVNFCFVIGILYRWPHYVQSGYYHPTRLIIAVIRFAVACRVYATRQSSGY
jgi:hypothetical protein